MLSEQEKIEMLEDAKSESRRDAFRSAEGKDKAIPSLDEYISFLDSIQKIFSPFKISLRHTRTGLNKL